ncbi:MAG TPA: glycosyl transferase [Opitutae bacterium]|nr:glycosyl transferase [Opitutae bacterium]|tara:strand:- start:327 stop:1058 length:732 start_codon:yes stop_codon:yes gene_type:complete
MLPFLDPADKRAAEHWAQAADPKRVRAWRRRLWVKQWVWRVTIGLAEYIKRALDIIISLGVLIFFSPLYLILMALVWLDGGRPVFYKQMRVGQSGKVFAMWKFRTMRRDAEFVQKDLIPLSDRQGVAFKMRVDPRVTRVGRLFRRFSVDEIPQFWNVLKGDMSLVGPRPPVPEELTRYKASELRRLHVKPGLTCFWQIRGRADLPFEEQVRLDVLYIYSESFWKDLKILVLTIPAVLFGRGAY